MRNSGEISAFQYCTGKRLQWTPLRRRTESQCLALSSRNCCQSRNADGALIERWHAVEGTGSEIFSQASWCLSIMSAKWPCRNAMWIFQPEFWGEFFDVNFGRWISWAWIFEGALFLLENIGPKNSTPEFGPKIRGSKIRIPEFGVEFGFTRCKIPSAETCPWHYVNLSCRCNVERGNLTPTKRDIRNADPETRPQTAGRMSEVSKGVGGQGVGARRSFPCQRFRPLFCAIFPMLPSGEGEHSFGDPLPPRTSENDI